MKGSPITVTRCAYPILTFAGTILTGFSAGAAMKLLLLHNPGDPFLDVEDVQLTARLARVRRGERESEREREQCV